MTPAACSAQSRIAPASPLDHGEGRHDTWHHINGETGGVVGHQHPGTSAVSSAAHSGQATEDTWHYAKDAATGEVQPTVTGHQHPGASVRGNGYRGCDYVPTENRAYFVPYDHAPSLPALVRLAKPSQQGVRA